MLPLSDEQKTMIETVRCHVRAQCRPLEDELADTGALPHVQALLLHDEVKALGGAGLSTVDRILCEEQFGHGSDCLIRRAFGNVYEPPPQWRDTQRAGWLEPTVRDERTCSIAITEPGAGSDAPGVKTRAMDRHRLCAQRKKASHRRRRVERLPSRRRETRRQADQHVHVGKGLPGLLLGKDQNCGAFAARRMWSRSPPTWRWSRSRCTGEEGQGFKVAMGASAPASTAPRRSTAR